MRLHPRSLRARALAALVAVAVAPPLLVLASAPFEAGVEDRMRRRTMEAAERAAAAVATLPDWSAVAAAVDAIAEDEAVWIQVVAADGAVRLDRDHEAGKGVLYAAGDLFFGPDGAPTLRDFDASLAPVARRAESRAALAAGASSGCRHSPERLLLVCHAAVKVPRAPEGDAAYLVYARESSRRAIRALHDLRYQLGKLTLFVLPLGVLLAFGLGRSIVRPVEALRSELLRRARAAVPKADLHVGGDEVGELASAFNALLASLAERTRSNEAFLADLVHEFKNPVAAARSAGESLAREEEPAPDRRRRLAAVVLKSCARLDALVSELLELARAEVGLPGEAREPVDLAALARGLAQALREDERYAGVSVTVDAPGEPVVVPGVARRIEAALRNLLDNAASFAGGGSIAVEVRRESDAAAIHVTDSGPGIAPEDLPRVFDRFFTTRGDRRGTGLGLALVKAVVEAHGGSVAAESLPAQGARFRVRLPFTPVSPGTA